MRGSIAIWHDMLPGDTDGYAPRAEIHVNIWRGERNRTYRGFDLLDIGIRFKELRSLTTLSIGLPFTITSNQVADLFEVMNDTPTLSAIFNDTLTAGEMFDGGRIFAASHTEKKSTLFFVSSCSDKDRRLSTFGSGSDACSVITLNDTLFDRLKNRVGDHYIRLRVTVPIDTKNGFISTIYPKDSAFLSTISANEVIECRLNERRNLPESMRERLQAPNCKLIDISAVHYFLIRDMNVEMTQSHTSFRKMRRLEPNLWHRYLSNTFVFNPENMIIYHWSMKASTLKSIVENFTALATFRAYYTGSLWKYAAIIVILGAMGSALQALAMFFLQILSTKVWTRLVSASDMTKGLIFNLIFITFIIVVLTAAVSSSRRNS